jgi:hypothetical protein
MTRASLLIVAPAVFLITPALGQEASACTYDTCALRVEGARILRGAEGTPAGRWGLFQTPDLTYLVQSSERATEHARIFEQTAPTAQWLGLAGALLLVAPRWETDRNVTSLELGAVIAGAGLSIYGTHLQVRAQRALSRAIWWYNRDLPRSPRQPVESQADVSVDTNGYIRMDDQRRLYIHYDHDPDVVVGSFPGEPSYEGLIERARGIEPGQRKRIFTADRTYQMNADGSYTVFGYLPAVGGFHPEPGKWEIKTSSREYTCYYDVLGRPRDAATHYLITPDWRKIEKCLKSIVGVMQLPQE